MWKRAKIERHESSSGRVSIVALIDSFGPRAVCLADTPDNWRFWLRSHNWRTEDGRLATGVMNAEKLVPLEPDTELNALQQTALANSVVRMNGRWTSADESGSRKFQLIDMVGGISDPELQAIADQLAQPVFVEDVQLGRLVLDRALGWFIGKLRYNDASLEVSIDAIDDGPNEQALSHTQSLWSEFRDWDRRIREFAVSELLELKNEGWSDTDENDDEVLVTRDQFKRRMKPKWFSASDHGHFEVFYDDGELFFGHVIIVSGSLKDGPNEATIAG